MFRTLTRTTMALALVVPLLFIGCESDTTGPGGSGTGTADFSGNWSVSFEVIAKRLCDGEIGEVIVDDLVVITQSGNTGTITIDDTPRDLTISGSTATSEMDDLELNLTISNGALGGTATLIDTKAACTETYSVTGSRTNEPPSSEFAGYWDFTTTITQSDCKGEPVDEVEDICLQVVVDGNTVSIQDEDGSIEGVGDGNSVVLRRLTEDETLEVTLDLAQGSLTGHVCTTLDDGGGSCQVTRSISGTKRTSPCPPPSESGYAGDWDVLLTVVGTSCFDEPTGEGTVACLTVSVDGFDITVFDGSSEGPITGSIDGDTAFLSRTSPSGTLNLSFQIDGDDLLGDASMDYITGGCAKTRVDYSVQGVRRSAACGVGEPGGPFAGYWNITGKFTQNDCKFVLVPDCSELVQFGDTVFFVGDDLQGTVSGNTLTVHRVEVDEILSITTDLSFQISGDGNSFSGTQSVTLSDPKDPESSCTSTATIAGTRTSTCKPGASGFGLAVMRR